MFIKFTIVIVACVTVAAVISFVQGIPVQENQGFCIDNSDCKEWCNNGKCDYWRV